MGSSTFWRMLKRGSRLKVWKTKPILLLRTAESSLALILEMSLPSSFMTPLVGVSRQPRMCMRVDLPEPEGPMIAKNSPSSILRFILCRASYAAAPVS